MASLHSLGQRVTDRLPLLLPVARFVYRRIVPRCFREDVAGRLDRHFGRRKDVTFLQVGACDGIKDDPIRQLVLDRPSWRGVLVEPQPENFAQLKRNYAEDAHRLHFLNCAIADGTADALTLYYLSEETKRANGISDQADKLASLNREHLEGYFGELPISEVTVPCKSVAAALAELEMDSVHFLVVDAEGAEEQILSDIDFDAHGIECVSFEHIHMSEDSLGGLISKLESFGFAVEMFPMDVFASRAH